MLTTSITVTHASSDFEVTTWDVNRLRVALLEVKSEISKPDSKIHDTNEPGCNELRILTKSFRPLLEDLEKLVMKDQGLKKKRIWRRDKDNAAALDRIHRQLELRTPMLGFYISTMKHSQLAQFQEKLGIAMVELDRRDSLGRSGQIDGEWDYNQWPVHEQLMVLRRELAEIGITDIDIEAHKSSIKALLRERLPSYHEAQSGLNHTEPSEVSLDAALLRTSEPEHHTRTRRVSGAQEPNVNEDPARSTFGPDIAAPSSPRNESEGHILHPTSRIDC